jgi:RHS repeat-associated protein
LIPGITTNFFDAFSRQFSQRLAMNQTNLVQYNALGQVVTNFDFKGQRTEFRYDQYGRVTNKFYFVTSLTHPSNSVSYAYNQLDQVTNITERYGSDADAIYAVNNVEPPSSDFARALAFINLTAPRWGGVLVPLALVCGVLTLIPRGRRLRDILAWYYLHGSWRLSGATAVCDHRTKRLRLPSLFWRTVTILTASALIVDDPSWDNWFIARADCSIPSNISTATTRITNYIYDFDGRVTQVNSPEGVINYSYDLATGRLTSTCTTNSYVAYTYDQLGRLKTVTASKRNGSTTDPATLLPLNEVTTYYYDKVGNRSEVDLPNGVVTTYLYDGLNRLTNLTHQAGGTNLAIYSYILDATGRRTNATEVLWQDTGSYLTNKMTWQFDRMYRLTNEVNLCSSTAVGASYTNAYVYDLAGNRWKQIQTAGNTLTITNLYDANDGLLREVTRTGSAYTETNNYAYDLNGSMIGRTNSATAGPSTNVYTYNLMNKLSGVTSITPSGTIVNGFQYNDQGIRVRTTGASTKYYLIDANNLTGYQQVLEEFSTLRGTPTMSYVIGDDVLAQAVSGAAFCLLYDGHGSTRQVASSSGGVTSRYNYDAYGVTQSTSTSTPQTSLLYCGEQYDLTLQMYNLRARYYNPANGRFNQRDTFLGNNFDPQSLHKYTYANCDPANGIDPTGQFTVLQLVIVVAIIAVIAVALVQLGGFFYAGYSVNADRMAKAPYKSWIETEAKAAGIEPRFLAAILETEIDDRGAPGNHSNTGDIWGSVLGDASVGLGQVKPSTAENILHYGHLRSALALWNRKTNIHVAAQYIKALIEAAKDIDEKNPGFHFFFDGNTNMTLEQYKLPMSAWDDAHKKLLAQQYTQTPWKFDTNAKYGYNAHLANRATGYYLGFWDIYTSSDLKSAYP